MVAEAVLLSVVVPTHHGAHRLPTLLAALARQDLQAPWDIVVVVDGIVDETPALLDSWRDRLEITVLTRTEPGGVADALTRGFDAARGTYLLRCDDDLDVPPTLLSSHVHAQAGRTDRVVLSATRDVFPDTAFAKAYGRAANRRALEAAYARPLDQRWMHLAACFSLHREAWASAGGFDARFAYGEDSELGYRLWTNGATFVLDPALEVRHLGPATSTATRAPRAFVSGASRRLFTHIHPEALPFAPPARGVKAGLWEVLVSATAFLARGRSSYRTLGRLTDRVLPLLPERVGSRAVAWLVESAGRSGLRHGDLDLHSYRNQKDAEIRSELRRLAPDKHPRPRPED